MPSINSLLIPCANGFIAHGMQIFFYENKKKISGTCVVINNNNTCQVLTSQGNTYLVCLDEIYLEKITNTETKTKSKCKLLYNLIKRFNK